MKLLRDRSWWNDAGLLKRIAIALIAIFLLYYPVGMFIVHNVRDDAGFQAGEFEVEGGSHSVAIAAALVNREVRAHWVPSDPFFLPGAALTRMPAYQRGMVSAVARFTIALSDQIARTRGSSTVDVDLQKATGLFNYPPTVWFYDTSVSWLPTASSDSQYKAGVEALKRYNERLAKGNAMFERRADSLLDTLDRFAADLGSSSGSVADFVDNQSVFAVFRSGELYYETKGKMYAYYLLMRELRRDFEVVINERQLMTTWKQTEESLRVGAELSTPIVINAYPDSMIFPSHLAGQGFYLMRARTQLREITNVLLK
jgi:hypothetical protein